MKAGIVGAGIIGRLLGFSLQKIGWDVTVFDRGNEKSASSVAAGLLAPVSELAKNDLGIYAMGVDAIQSHWPKILAEFADEIYFKATGSIVVAHPRDHAELEQFSKLIAFKTRNNYPEEEISQWEPELTHFQQGYFFREEAHIDAQAIFKILGDQLKIVYGDVAAVSAGEITINDQHNYFDWVFDCRGLGAKEYYNDLRGVRGEIVILFAPDVRISRPVHLLHPRYNLYIVPRRNNYFWVGASEIEAEDYSEISVRSVLELLTAASSVCTSFLEARILRTATQCRPTLIDHLPKIKWQDGLLAVNGLYRHGYLIAPTLTVDIVNWLTEGLSAVKYSQFWEHA